MTIYRHALLRQLVFSSLLPYRIPLYKVVRIHGSVGWKSKVESEEELAKCRQGYCKYQFL
jgi:hypothetical protein